MKRKEEKKKIRIVRSLGSVREITFTGVWGKLVNFSEEDLFGVCEGF